jgi:hypothetical protein
VEKGSNIADHVKVQNKTFSLEVFVTNTPITKDIVTGRGDPQFVEIKVPTYKAPFDGTPGAFFREAKGLASSAIGALLGSEAPVSSKVQVLSFPTEFDRVKEVQELLISYQESAAVWTIITSTRTYENMVISRVGVPRDQPGGSNIQIDTQEIRTVTTAKVAAPKPLEKRGAPAVSKGSQGTKTAKDAVKSTSLIIKGIKALTGT